MGLGPAVVVHTKVCIHQLVCKLGIPNVQAAEAQLHTIIKTTSLKGSYISGFRLRIFRIVI